ncbi:hypothetical protein EST38_g9674 [Candolleomyces aberdarensis]|uniref:Uncharacterized protein n=1 Tax=Candolleomyces aberdarensis TaxID=2316362 RepID=A0A4Q2DBI6_9AGAR|nr:hypothetical protein EST38_g9674 [Candolleomyces aberdarensis]
MDAGRIASRDYQPTDDDVLRARLRTIGVQEHKFTSERAGLNNRYQWHLYDVGGAKSDRAAWVPYFDNVDALIFLA